MTRKVPQQSADGRHQRPDTPEVVERPKASQDVVDALAKRYPSRRKEASLLVSALRSPGDAPIVVTGTESGPVTVEAASQCGLAVARVKCSSDETGSKLLERCAVAADGKSDRVSAESLARRLDAAALAAPLSRGVVILEDGDRLLSRRAGDEGATALRRLCAACRLADTAPTLCITGDDRALSQVSQRLRDPVRIHLRDNATTTTLTQALCDSEEPLFRDFCRAVATAAKRETSDIGHLAKLTRSAPLFDLYKTQNGGAAGYDAIRPVLTTAIPGCGTPSSTWMPCVAVTFLRVSRNPLQKLYYSSRPTCRRERDPRTTNSCSATTPRRRREGRSAT